MPPYFCQNPTPVLDTYFRFAHERHQIYLRRLAGITQPGLLTGDPILQTYRFTNPFRVADRVSQYLIREVIPKGSQEPIEVLFRVLLFKIFNKIDTWEGLCLRLKTSGLDCWPSWHSFNLARRSYVWALAELKNQGPIYSSAYVMPDPGYGLGSKSANHLELIWRICTSAVPDVASERWMFDQGTLYRRLVEFRGVGKFLAYQYAIDLSYTSQFDLPPLYCRQPFVVAGPGAKDGIRKCFFPGFTKLTEQQAAEAIQYTASVADERFARLGLEPPMLNGRKLELIDYQNLFCETDKYSRVAHPEIVVGQKRTKIKQRYRPSDRPLLPFVAPPSWNL